MARLRGWPDIASNLDVPGSSFGRAAHHALVLGLRSCGLLWQTISARSRASLSSFERDNRLFSALTDRQCRARFACATRIRSAGKHRAMTPSGAGAIACTASPPRHRHGIDTANFCQHRLKNNPAPSARMLFDAGIGDNAADSFSKSRIGPMHSLCSTHISLVRKRLLRVLEKRIFRWRFGSLQSCVTRPRTNS